MSLFDKIKIGNLVLKNRIVLAAMTRLRADPKTGLANDLHKQYYSQRSGAGLILTEAVCVSQRGDAFPGAANIMTEKQAEAWKPVVEAVKKKGSHIYLQSCHAGRNCHKILNGGLETWGPSAIAPRAKVHPQQIPYEKPHEMTQSEINQVVQEFHDNAKLIKRAGFDGIHLHGANGYLIDEFLRSSSNKRTDKYGGSAQNRARFLIQIIESIKGIFPVDRLSVKLSPVARYVDMNDDNPKQTYIKILQLLDKQKLGAVEINGGFGETQQFDYPDPQKQFPNILKTLRPHFSGVIIGNQGFTPETAQKAIADKQCDMISFGRPYIPNPDLAERIQHHQPLNTNVNHELIYGGGGAAGYTDYPFYKA